MASRSRALWNPEPSRSSPARISACPVDVAIGKDQEIQTAFSGVEQRSGPSGGAATYPVVSTGGTTFVIAALGPPIQATPGLANDQLSKTKESVTGVTASLDSVHTMGHGMKFLEKII